MVKKLKLNEDFKLTSEIHNTNNYWDLVYKHWNENTK